MLSELEISHVLAQSTAMATAMRTAVPSAAPTSRKSIHSTEFCAVAFGKATSAKSERENTAKEGICATISANKGKGGIFMGRGINVAD